MLVCATVVFGDHVVVLLHQLRIRNLNQSLAFDVNAIGAQCLVLVALRVNMTQPQTAAIDDTPHFVFREGLLCFATFLNLLKQRTKGMLDNHVYPMGMRT
jgi:hypothetical protein